MYPSFVLNRANSVSQGLVSSEDPYAGSSRPSRGGRGTDYISRGTSFLNIIHPRLYFTRNPRKIFRRECTFAFHEFWQHRWENCCLDEKKVYRISNIAN